MATTNEDGFNSLDPLGPEYGRINQPLLDSKGLAPFEGNPLRDSPINFPKDFYPTVPRINDLETPGPSVRKNIVGTPPGQPKPSRNFEDIKRASQNYIRGQIQAQQDQNSYAKIYSYDASPDGNAFYKRYAAYGQETLDKIGFSPIRDNEALFNDRTSNWQDFKRMMVHSAIPLFGRGFVSGPKSLWRMVQGDFSGADLEDAKAYTEAAAIGQSTKGGAFGFVNNSMMNFSYSAGIMLEVVAEEMIGAFLAPETLGGSFFLTSANAMKNVGKAVRGLDLAQDGYKAVNNTLDAVNSVQGARTFWQNAKAIGTGPLSPLKNTIGALDKLNETVKKGDQLYNFTNLAKAYKTAGGFYKDVRALNMAVSEARLEAGMVENQVYDNLYNEYYAKNGKAPDDKLQKQFIKQSKDASLNTFTWNAMLIYGSEALVIPNIVGPKGGLTSFMRNSMKEFAEIGGGKFGKLGSIMYNNAKKQFVFEKNNLLNLGKSWLRQPIYKSAAKTIGYFKANFSEGIQENLQEVISGANEKYYTDSFKSPALRGHLYSKGVANYGLRSQRDYMKEELGKQFTAQGFETFASGFFMGMLATPLNNAIPLLSTGYNRMFNKEAYNELKSKKLEMTKGIVQTLNSIGIKDFLDAKVFNYAVQDITAGLKRDASKAVALDAYTEAFTNQIDTVLNTGTMSVFTDTLSQLQQLSPEEFEESVPNIPKGEGAKYQAKIPEIIERANKLESKYKYYRDNFPNPASLENLPPKDSPEYEDAIALHMGWNLAVKNAVYFNEAFEDTLKRKRDILGAYMSKTPLRNISQTDAEVLFDYGRLKNETAMLKSEVESLEEAALTDPLSKKDLENKKKKLAALEQLRDKTAEAKLFLGRYDNAEEVRKELEKQKGSPVSDEELEEALDKFHGEFTDENKTDKLYKYYTAYRNYLKAIADTTEDFVFDRDIDESFVLLVDQLKLDSDSRKLMKYVNLLHDPQAFMDVAARNQKWMKDLYNKRGQIYEELVKTELNAVIDNALLNQLANKGIYISMEDFAAWQQEGTPPKEFYDHTKKIIIPEGSTLYNEYYSLFEQAAELKDQESKPLPESLDQELKNTLDKLDGQMEAELQNVPKIDVKVAEDKILPETGDRIKLTGIIKNVPDGYYISANYGGNEPLVFYKESEGLIRLDDPNGEQVNPETVAVDFYEADIYRLEQQPDPELAEPIRKKYEELKNRAKQEYATKAKVPETVEQKEFVPITSDIEVEDIPQDLYNKLYTLFTDKYLKKISDDEFVNMTPDQERNLFVKFIQSDTEAKQLIDEYNKSAKLQQTTKETGEKEDFEFMYQGKKIKTANAKNLVDLRRLQRRLQNSINEINKEKEPTAEQITLKSNYMVIVSDLEKLIATRAKKGLSPEQREAIDKIQELQARQGEIEITPNGYVINGVLHDRVTRAIQKLKGEKYAYSAESDVATAFYLTIGEQGFNNESIDAFINELKSRALPGFSGYTYTELEKELQSQLSEDFSIDVRLEKILDTVSEKTYEESRISGNYVDNQIKNLFDGSQVEFDDSKITEEAFNNLFGPDGHLTKLKQRVDNGEIFIVSQGIRVFDTDLKIAGEIDLLVADTTGQITIVDVKTGEKVKWDNFKKKGNANSKMEDYQLQQTAYANLLNRMIGVNPKIALLPIQMVREPETGKILSAGKPTSPTLLNTEFLINLSKDTVQERIDSIIPPPNKAPEIEPSSVVPGDAESSDDAESPAVDSTEDGRETVFIADQDRYTPELLKEDLDKVNTIDEMNQVIANLQIKVNEQKVALEDVEAMGKLIQDKMAQLSNTQTSKISPIGLKPGDQLVLKTTIFIDKGSNKGNVFAEQDSTVVVKSVNQEKQTVTITPLGKSTQKTIPFNKLNEMAILMDTVTNSSSEPTPTMSTAEKEILNESTDTVETFINSKEKLEAVEKNASSKTIAELDDELLKDIDC